MAEQLDAGSARICRSNLVAREVSLKPKKVRMHTRRSKNTKKNLPSFRASFVKIRTLNWRCEHRLEKNPGFAGTLHGRMRKVG